MYLLLYIVDADTTVAPSPCFMDETTQQRKPRSSANENSTGNGQHEKDDAGVPQVRRRRVNSLLSNCVALNVRIHHWNCGCSVCRLHDRKWDYGSNSRLICEILLDKRQVFYY